MARPKRTEDPYPVSTKIRGLVTAEGSPDPEARVCKCRARRLNRPGPESHKVTELRCGTSNAVIGVKVIHRRPKCLQTIHVLTDKPVEMLKYLAVAVIGV